MRTVKFGYGVSPEGVDYIHSVGITRKIRNEGEFMVLYVSRHFIRASFPVLLCQAVQVTAVTGISSHLLLIYFVPDGDDT